MPTLKFDLDKIDKTYLIAEIGINHNGDVSFVKKIIDYASVFGWDCVKLQKRNPDISTPEHQKDVMRETPWGKITYLEYRRKLELSKEQYDDIFNYASGKVHITASAWDTDSLDFMCKYDIPFIKIPSPRLTDDNLLEYAVGKKSPIILSTGMSTVEEVDHAVGILKRSNKGFALLHTISTYPAHENELNLKMIDTLKKRYGCTVGYSGHEFGLITTTVAVAMGAKIIERHVTLNRTLWGTDQMASVEPGGMLKLSTQIRAIETAFGDGMKKVYDSELAARKRLRGV